MLEISKYTFKGSADTIKPCTNVKFLPALMVEWILIKI